MYTTELKQAKAAWPRGLGSSIEPSDEFQIAYKKYSATSSPSKDQIVVNLIFAHGTGMNKSVWAQHIKQLYDRSKETNWHLGNVLAVDCVSHGDSALLNKDKLGWGFDWRDGGKDLAQLVKHEASTTGDFKPSPTTLNILVGHSFGGFHCTYAAYLEPTLFSGCIAIEPVLFVDGQFKELFFNRMKKVRKGIVDSFDLMEDAVRYFQKASFYKTLEPSVLKEYVSDELYKDNGKIRTKASLEAQMATYNSAFFSLDYDQDVLKYLRIPYLHVVGTDAAWNLPQTVDFVQESVSPVLLESKEIDGTHLMFGENVKDTLDTIQEFCQKRVNFSLEHYLESPWLKYGGNRKDVLKQMFPLVSEGNYDKAFWYGRPNPKI